MRIISLIIVLCVSHLGMTQTRVFNDSAKIVIQARDSLIEIESVKPDEQPYDFLANGMGELEGLFLSKIEKVAKSRPDQLMMSQNLMQLSDLSTAAWKGSQYTDAKKWRKLTKHIDRAFNQSTSSFNYTKEVSFRIRLVDNHKRRYYCDKKVGISELDLYKGKKPRGLTKEEKEELPDPIPLECFTEEELVDQFYRELRKNKILRDVKAGRYSCVGVSIELDERTVHKNRIPTARVVVILGARRLRDLRIKKQEVEPSQVN